MSKNDKVIQLDKVQQAKESAQQMIQNIQEEQQNEKGYFEELFKELEGISPDLGSFDELGVLLTLPEEAFAQIGPVFLDELEKSYNNVTDKIALAQSLNITGARLEDVQEECIKLCEQIDEQMGEFLSRQKRDFLKRMIGLTHNAVAESAGVTKRIVSVPIEYCRENAKCPTYAHLGDAGMDIYALEDITIAPGETKLIPTGIKVALPKGYELQVRPKSGRCLKTKLRVANAPGTIDSGYRDEIGVIVDNIEPFIKGGELDENGNLTGVLFGQSYTIGAGEKFAQLVLSEVPTAKFYEVESVYEIPNDGRNGGFGSTGLT